MTRSRGWIRKRRDVLKKKPRDRGLLPLSKLLYEYKVGEKVVIRIEPSIHKGMPHPRYQGKVGVVQQRRGRAYVVDIKEGTTIKRLIARPEHLVPNPN